MHLKTISGYLSLTTLALLTLWSQSGLLFLVLVASLLLTFHKGVQQKVRQIINRLSPLGRQTGSWLLAIALASVTLVTIDTYFFGIYTLRSSSMEPTFYSGNIFLMNKVKIGPSKWIEEVDRFKRLPGLNHLTYGDLIVFHFPEADTVFTNSKEENYHFKRREAEIKNNKKISNQLSQIEYKPVNERPRFIKRVIALPGDTLEIINGRYLVNGQPPASNKLLVNKYVLHKNTPKAISRQILESSVTNYTEGSRQVVEIQAGDVEEQQWESWLEQQERPLNMADPYIFPFSKSSLWNASFWGPAVVPQAGQTIEINKVNLPLYLRIIKAYEGNKAEIADGLLYIDDQVCHTYTFRMNYYWVAGDNRPHSFDSRYWGFVPDNHIIGIISKLPFSD